MDAEAWFAVGGAVATSIVALIVAVLKEHAAAVARAEQESKIRRLQMTIDEKLAATGAEMRFRAEVRLELVKATLSSVSEFERGVHVLAEEAFTAQEESRGARHELQADPNARDTKVGRMAAQVAGTGVLMAPRLLPARQRVSAAVYSLGAMTGSPEEEFDSAFDELDDALDGFREAVGAWLVEQWAYANVQEPMWDPREDGEMDEEQEAEAAERELDGSST